MAARREDDPASALVAPLNVEGDRNPSSWKDGKVTTTPGFKEAFRQYAEGGWQGVQHPAEFGGQGLPKTIGACCWWVVPSKRFTNGWSVPISPKVRYFAPSIVGTPSRNGRSRRNRSI